MERRASPSEERIGVTLVVLGGLVLVLSGLWYLEVVSLPAVPSPGVVLSVLGIGQLLFGAYLLLRVADTS